jgi:hypothetical protein
MAVDDRLGVRRLWSRSAAGVTKTHALGALATLVALELLLAIAAAARPSPLVNYSERGYPGWMSGPLHLLGGAVPSERWFLKATLVLVVGGMCLAYALALLGASRVSRRQATLAIVAAHAVLFVGPPLLLSDAFTYIDYARAGTLHGLNPFADETTGLEDPIQQWTQGLTRPTVYGPLFTLTTYALVPLGIPGSLWGLKALTVLASLGAVALVFASARRLGQQPVPAALAVGLNPLLLLYGVGGLHNDMLLMLFLAAGVWFALAGRDRLVGPSVVAAAATKVSALPMAPFVVLGSRRPGRAWAWAAIAALVAVVGAAALFGVEAPGLRRGAAEQETRNTLPWLLSRAAGYDHVPAGIRIAGFVVLAAVVAGLLRWVLRQGGDWVTAAGWSAFTLLVVLSTVSPYYIAALLPFAALSRSAALRLATLGLGLFLLTYFNYQFRLL